MYLYVFRASLARSPKPIHRRVRFRRISRLLSIVAQPEEAVGAPIADRRLLTFKNLSMQSGRREPLVLAAAPAVAAAVAAPARGSRLATNRKQ